MMNDLLAEVKKVRERASVPRVASRRRRRASSSRRRVRSRRVSKKKKVGVLNADPPPPAPAPPTPQDEPSGTEGGGAAAGAAQKKDTKASKKKDGAGKGAAPASASDVENPPPPASGAGDDVSMDAFFADVTTVKGILEQIRRALVKLNAKHEESKSVTRSERMKQMRDDMSAIIEQTSREARECKLRLENLDATSAEASKLPGKGPGSSQERTRTAIASSLKMKLKTQMAEFQDLRSRLQTEYKEVVERRYFAVTGEAADEETLDHLIETGESESMFQKAIMEQGRGQILETVAEIQERHHAVKQLERKLMELHQIFLDMSGAFSLHAVWSPYDRVRVVNFIPRGLLFPARVRFSAHHPSLVSIPALDAFQLRF